MENQTASFSRYMRTMHRDIGYFVIGLTLIFTLSGILLVFRDTPFLKSPEVVKRDLQAEMSIAEVQSELKLKRVKVVDNDDQSYGIIMGKEQIGFYHTQSGQAEYTVNTYPAAVNSLNVLHKASSQSRHAFLAVVYGVLLLFLALSPIFFYRPGTKRFKRSLIYFGGGLAVALASIALV